MTSYNVFMAFYDDRIFEDGVLDYSFLTLFYDTASILSIFKQPFPSTPSPFPTHNTLMTYIPWLQFFTAFYDAEVTGHSVTDAK